MTIAYSNLIHSPDINYRAMWFDFFFLPQEPCHIYIGQNKFQEQFWLMQQESIK